MTNREGLFVLWNEEIVKIRQNQTKSYLSIKEPSETSNLPR